MCMGGCAFMGLYSLLKKLVCVWGGGGGGGGGGRHEAFGYV